ncbi:sporulation protein YunB [Natronobacillus azotifigens]|uniref:Sporulation protein YunB n=1 Tax=Natronobacillus azotifigens TaxID=472978 RepID=A0A9J6RCM4_9BACI|nr:sporulation protein YunB [Natronobacillus azotifigens]
MRRPRTRIVISGKHLIFLTTILFLFATFASIVIVNDGVKPVLLDIAETRNKQYANMAMGIAVSKKLNDDLEIDELIQFNYDQSGRVVSYQINAAMENRVQRNIQYRVETFLQQLEQGVIPDVNAPVDLDLESADLNEIEQLQRKSDLIEIPLGQVLGLPLLANLGPKIPVNLEVIGYVNTEVETRITGVKINSVHIEPVVHIEVEIRTIIPFGTQTAQIRQSIPIGSGGFSGDVPQYYNQGSNNDVPLSIPLDPIGE